MRNSWKKTAAFVLAFTLVAAPLTQTAGKGGLFGGTTIIAHAADEVSENISLVASDSSNLSMHEKAKLFQRLFYHTVKADTEIHYLLQ